MVTPSTTEELIASLAGRYEEQALKLHAWGKTKTKTGKNSFNLQVFAKIGILPPLLSSQNGEHWLRMANRFIEYMLYFFPSTQPVAHWLGFEVDNFGHKFESRQIQIAIANNFGHKYGSRQINIAIANK